MPTERLYYSNSFLRQFEAHLVSMEPVDDKFHIVLDRTAFYPTGGGQPNDLGTINDVEVIDVFEREPSGEVVHVTKSGIVGNQATGTINWLRRQDHMQQHTGQHILSAAFVELCDAPTVGFHLGAETSTIDLKTALSIPDYVGLVVDLADTIVFEDRVVSILNVTREEAEAMRLRKESEREGVLRIVDVTDFDRTPCGGTHVARTGQIGLIQARKVERYKQGWRVEFVCGWRALRQAQIDFGMLTRASQLLSASLDQIPSLLEKQIDESKAARRERARLLDELAVLKARDLLREAKSIGEFKFLAKRFREEDVDFVKMLAQRATTESKVVVLFMLEAAKTQLVFATSVDSGVDAGQLFKKCAQQFPLRGGGSKHLAQGSLEDSSAINALADFVQEQISHW
jgi:alanyl-tRNA synthetase